MRYVGAVTVLLMPFLVACGAGSPSSPQTTLSGIPSAATEDATADALALKGIVALKGEITGQLTSSTQLEEGSTSWLNVIDAAGNSPRIGKFTLVISYERNTATGAEEGFYLFTTPKGTLTATFVGDTVASSLNVFTVDDTITITEGTGRFAGATGGLQATRVYEHTVGADVTGSVTGQVNLQ